MLLRSAPDDMAASDDSWLVAIVGSLGVTGGDAEPTRGPLTALDYAGFARADPSKPSVCMASGARSVFYVALADTPGPLGGLNFLRKSPVC
jgi:hypothetical protein